MHELGTETPDLSFMLIEYEDVLTTRNTGHTLAGSTFLIFAMTPVGLTIARLQ